MGQKFVAKPVDNREQETGDTTGTALVPWVGYFHPMLKYKYIFQNKIIRKQFFQTALGNCYGLKLAKCRLQFLKNKFIVLFIFRYTFVPNADNDLLNKVLCAENWKLMRYVLLGLMPKRKQVAIERTC